MDVFGPLFHVALRSLVVLFPLTVGWLAFRRLAISTSSNAWIYAVMCLLSAIAAAGVLPWALALTPLNWTSLLLALACPALWIGVVLICDMSRHHGYGIDPLLHAARTLSRKAPLPTEEAAQLVAEDHDLPGTPLPVFRHRATLSADSLQTPGMSSTTRSILSLARDIRGNPTSESRRPKLLPPPEAKELPFLRNTRGA